MTAANGPIYLDNAATTQVAEEVAEAIGRCMCQEYGNPSSAHQAGIVAEQSVRQSAEVVLSAIGDEGGRLGKLVWTSGGTESDALGIMGAARARKRLSHLVLNNTEHAAVRESAKQLESEGFSVSKVPVLMGGKVSADKVASQITDKSGVLAIMLVNNEVGSVYEVAAIARAAKTIQPEIHVHCDAVQALGKIPIDVAALGVDSLAVAAHKLHGPKGSGALWLRNGARIEPFWFGGGQQEGLRPGTHNVPGIVGLAAATSLAMKGLAERAALHTSFQQRLIEACTSANLRFQINAEDAPRAPHILSLGFSGCPAEPLLHVLESRGVYVSAGSACSERNRKPSAVLSALDVPADCGTLRLSFGRYTTAEEIDTCCEVLIDAVRSF